MSDTTLPGHGRPVLQAALAYAARGWPVLPCQPGGKAPATAHSCRDATTDPGQITAWFARHSDRNLGIATGGPGLDVLDIDVRLGGSGYPALRCLARAGLTAGGAAWIHTPGGGLHAYLTGTAQRNGHLPGRHVDFGSAGGYVLAPPSPVNGRSYRVVRITAGSATVDWAAVTSLLAPRAGHARPLPRFNAGTQADLARLASWVAQLAQRRPPRSAPRAVSRPAARGRWTGW